MTIQEFSKKLDNLLSPELFSYDNSMNGLQVDGGAGEVKKVAFGVDASVALFDQAHKVGANMVVVHHGLFWGKPLAVVGSHRDRLSTLLNNSMSLYASHLPLDAHREVGNNGVMADMLGLQDLEPLSVGWVGNLPESNTIEKIGATLGIDLKESVLLPFGPREIRRIGIVSGGGGFALPEAVGKGVDAFITGEVLHQLYHYAAEDCVTVLGGGHYHTETFGVRALAKYCKEAWDIETCFLDLPTNL